MAGVPEPTAPGLEVIVAASPRRCVAASPCRFFLAVGLALVAAAGGCSGSGWARIEPVGAAAPDSSRVFDEVSAYLPADTDKAHPLRPLAVDGLTAQLDPAGEPLRWWRLLLFAEPGDVPGRLRVVAALGMAERRGKPVWRCYIGEDDVESWRYRGRTMVHGPVLPADNSAWDSQQRLSACVVPSLNKDRYAAVLGKLLDLLEKAGPRLDPELRGAFGSGSPEAKAAESVARLRKLLGRGKRG
jgi:hypothetical protein